MGRRVDVRQVERSVGRRQDRSTRQRDVTATPRHQEGRLRASRAMGRTASVADLEFGEAQTQTPGGCPFYPSGGQPSLQRLDIVLLAQVVVDRAQHEPELQSHRPSNSLEL